ncbi:MAG TPA: hypothetical protein VF782_01415 [Allosphingosinicella sp.]|jgi:pyruvate-formate lyase-activating enzyme
MAAAMVNLTVTGGDPVIMLEEVIPATRGALGGGLGNVTIVEAL